MAKTYTAAGSATAGDVYTASAHNVIVTDVNNFIVPAACLASATTTQNISNALTTAVTFPAERFDTDAIHDVSVNNTRFTITTPGIYQVSAFVEWSGSTGGTYRQLSIRVDGTTIIAASTCPVAANVSNVSVAYDFTNGQYFEITAYQDSAVTMTVSANRFASVCWIGRTS